MSGIVSRRGVAGLALGLALVAAAMLALVAGGGAGPAEAQKGADPTRPILAVSNNWDGTVDLVDPRTFERLERINIAPDRARRKREIALSPDKLAFFLAIRQAVGEGHDQFADDAFTSPNGRLLYVSRPSLADVVAINMRTEKIVWRVPMEGYRSDHMAISENGRRLLVSDSTEAKVQVINTRRGEIVDSFPSGDTPHENNFSENGRRIFHASIGSVYTPLDQPEVDTTKGRRYFQIVDARTMEVRRRLNMGKVLDQAGFPNMSAAVRPMALSPNERFLYFQVSFFHGYIEYDLRHKRVTRVVTLPQSQEVQEMPREEYLLDSAHHGIAMRPQGDQLCIAGTMSDYAAVVNRRSTRYRTIRVGEKPYWSTTSENGRYCFVSVSGEDRVAVISFRKRKEVASIPTGDHPQRMRTGFVRRSFVR